MKSCLILAFLLCVVASEHSKHVHVENNCTDYVDFELDVLNPKSDLKVVRFMIHKNPESGCFVQYRLTAPEGQRLQFTMHNFTLAPRTEQGLCSKNYLQVTDGDSLSKRFCGVYKDEKELVQIPSHIPNTTISKLVITYYQSEQVSALNLSLGLDFTVAAVLYGEEGSTVFKCPLSESSLFKCRSNLCLPMGLRCDGQPNCPAGEDELDCHAYQPDSGKGFSRKWMFILIGGAVCIVLAAVVVVAIIRFRAHRFQSVSTNVS